MRGDRLLLALLAGIGFTALLALSLNIPVAPVEMLAGLLLAPGGIVGSLLFKSRQLDPYGLGSPILILVFSSIIYSAIAYLVVRRIKGDPTTRLLSVVAAVVVLLAGLACVPSISALWPTGMAELAEKERTLRQGLPLSLDLTSARAFLRGHGIEFNEFEADSNETVLQKGDTKMVAAPGDHVLSAIIPTEAGQFPCGYRVDVVLVFDGKEKLKKSHIERFPLCP